MSIPLLEWRNIEKELSPLLERVNRGEITTEDFKEVYNSKIAELNEYYSNLEWNLSFIGGVIAWKK